MRMAAALVVAIGALSALVGVAVAIVAFEPIPYADSIDFFRGFFKVGGWDGYGFQQLYVRHNEHRLVVPRLWFLLDLWLFSATQASLIVVIVLSSVAHAALLAWTFARMGHRGAPLWAFAAAAVGATLSPAQWENLVWSFQVQFIQVWLFATAAFVAVAFAEGRGSWLRSGVAILCGLASTYSMANGILVWPLLIALALWRGSRGGPLVLLVVAACSVIGVEAATYQAHTGHGDPLQTIRQPLILARYALRYLTAGVAVVGTLGQELLGSILVAAWAAFAVEALLRRDRFEPGRAVLLGIGAFVIGAAVLTALGRITFGLGQANAVRYATPSLVFMVAVAGLLLDRLSRSGHQRVLPAVTVAGAAILLVPGMVDLARHLQAIVDQRNARADAMIGYASAGYRPGTMLALYPAEVPYLRTVVEQLDRNGLGPFADRSRVSPSRDLLDAPMPASGLLCQGEVSEVGPAGADGRLRGWFSAGLRTEPRWVVAVDQDRRAVAWGAGHFDWRRLGKSLRRQTGRWSFEVAMPTARGRPAALVVLFADGGTCRIDAAIAPADGG